MGLKHPFNARGQEQTSWPYDESLEGNFSTIMSYSPKTGWVGLTAADIAVLQFLYGAPQGRRSGTQRPEIENILGDKANGERPAAEQVFHQDEPLPAPPQFASGAPVMTEPGRAYSFTASFANEADSAELEIYYFLSNPTSNLPFRVGTNDKDVRIEPDEATFSAHLLQPTRLLHKQQIIAVAMNPDRPDLWSQSFKTVFAYWPTIDALSAALSAALSNPSRTPQIGSIAFDATAINRLLATEDIDDDTPVSQKIADLSAYPNAKLIWKDTGSQFLRDVDTNVEDEIFSVLSDAELFEIRGSGESRGLYVRNTPLDHQTPRDRNSDNKYDLFIEYGAAGAEKHIAFRITVTDEAFEEEESSVMPQMVVSMDVM